VILLRSGVARGDDTPHVLRGHRGQIFAVKLSDDGSRVASCSRDGTIKIWDAVSGNEIQSFRDPDRESSGASPWVIAFVPHGTGIVSAGPSLRREIDGDPLRGGFHEFVGTTINVWEPSRGQSIRCCRFESSLPRGVASSRDGSLIAFSNERLDVKVWDVAKGIVTASSLGPKGEVGGSDGTWGFDEGVRRFVAVTRSELPLPGVDGRPPMMRPGRLVLCDLATSKVRTIADPDGGGYGSVALSRDGRTISTVLYRKPEQAAELQFLDFETGEISKAYQVERMIDLSCLVFSPDGKFLIASHGSGELLITDRISGRQFRERLKYGGRVRALAFLDGLKVRVVVGGSGLTDERDPITSNLLPKPLMVFDFKMPLMSP